MSRKKRKWLLFPLHFAFVTWTSMFKNYPIFHYIPGIFNPELLSENFREDSRNFKNFSDVLTIKDNDRLYLGGWFVKLIDSIGVNHEKKYSLLNIFWSLLCDPRTYKCYFRIIRCFVPNFREQESSHSPVFSMGICAFKK